MDLSKSIRDAMEKQGLTDERELFRAMMFFFKHDHVTMLQSLSELPVFAPSRINMAGPAKTLVEFIRNYATFTLCVHETQERQLRAAGDEAGADNLKQFITNMRAIIDILNSQLPSWTAEGDQYQAGGREFREKLLQSPNVKPNPPRPPSCPTCGQFLPT